MGAHGEHAHGVIEHDVSTPDGRVLRVAEAGDPDGVAILELHGMPGSREQYGPNIELALASGIRSLSYDRPGYGGSTRQPDRTVADCADDIRAIAAALDIDRLAVWGVSGGGPHALACAALLGDLAPAVAVLASPVPYSAPGIDYLAGMGEYNVEDIRLQLSDPVAARAKCEADTRDLLSVDLSGMIEILRSLLAPVDAAVLSGELGEFLHESMCVGLAPGPDGLWDDNVATLDGWGFGVEQIRTPTLLMHGREDRFVPFAHGEWLAAHVPGVDARLFDEDGHVSLVVNRLGEVFDWLLDRMA